MKKKLNLLWNLKFNFFSVAERPLTFFAYFLNAKKVGRRRLVISPAKAGAFLFSHTRLPFPPRPLLPFGRISPAAKPRVRLPAPPFGFAAQKRARHFAARNHPVRLSASRPWLRHPAPLFCRSRHGCAAPGPQRQNPGACRHSAPFRLRRNRAAGRCPRRGQRARYPIFAPLKCGPALAPRRLSPFGSISPPAKPRGRSLPPPGATCSLPHFRSPQMWPRARTPALVAVRLHFASGETARPVVAPAGGNVLATPFSLRSNVAPRSHPGAACPVYRTENALFCSCRVFQYLTMQVKAPFY